MRPPAKPPKPTPPLRDEYDEDRSDLIGALIVLGFSILALTIIGIGVAAIGSCKTHDTTCGEVETTTPTGARAFVHECWETPKKK